MQAALVKSMVDSAGECEIRRRVSAFPRHDRDTYAFGCEMVNPFDNKENRS